jgi:hypothetical protein
MKNPRFTLLAFMVFGVLPATMTSCGTNDSAAMQAKIDSLSKQINKSYKPGLGEFMMGIQVHHAKIWFAGKKGNWPLADFEVGEIKETLEDVKQYCSDRPEVKSLPIIYPALDSLVNAIKTKSPQQFEKSFVFLTKSCNDCHQTTHHEFNVIKTPDVPPVTNQVYTPKK